MSWCCLFYIVQVGQQVIQVAVTCPILVCKKKKAVVVTGGESKKTKT